MQFNFAWFSCWCAKILSGSLCLWKVWIITKVKKEDSSLSKNRHQRHRCENEAESESLGLCTLLPSFPWPLESLQLCFAICFLLGAPYTKEVNERAKNGDVGRCCYSSWGDALVLMILQYITYLKIATRKKKLFIQQMGKNCWSSLAEEDWISCFLTFDTFVTSSGYTWWW